MLDWKKTALPLWVIGLTFFLVLLIATIVRLPASLLSTSLPGVEGQFEGTLYNAFAPSLKFGNTTLENVVVDMSPLSFLIGPYKGNISVRGQDVAGQSQFMLDGATLDILDLDMQVKAPVYLFGERLITINRLDITSARFQDIACTTGQADLTTDILKAFFQKLDLMDAPVLEGQGICTPQGTVQLSLHGSSAAMNAELEAVLQGQNLLADVAISPKVAVPDTLMVMLRANGFTFDGKTITGQVSIELTPDM